VRTLGLGLLLGLYACGSADPSDSDTRLGEQGKVKFTGGGGCNGSTTLAAGSKAELTLEPQAGVTLPASLAVSSTDAKVLTATSAGSKKDRVILQAVANGSAAVELKDNGSLFDRLGFSVAPAGKVDLEKKTDYAFAGATHAVKLGEIYGACGTKECALIGGGFLKWTATPAAGLTLLADAGRTATFTSGKTAGAVTLKGAEPTSGKVLVEQAVTLVDAKSLDKVTAEAIVAPPKKNGEDQKVLDPAPMPLSVKKGSLLMIRLAGTTTDGKKVSIWGGDVAWTIGGDKGAVALFGTDGQSSPAEGPIFSAKAAGKAKLEGKLATLGKTITVDVTVTD